MTPRPPVSMAALCADLAAETAELRALVAPLTETEWRLPTPAPGWTIADQLVHLADVDAAAVQAATRPDDFRAALEEPRRTVDDRVARHRDLTGEQVLTWFDASRSRLLETFAALDPRARAPWYGPPMSTASSLTARIMETWAHGRAVADTLGVAPEATPRLRHVAHLGVLARPFSLRDAPDAAVDIRVELAAPGGETWTWGEPDAPDRVRAPALDFCLLVTRRRHPADLALDVDGPVAHRWIGVAQAYAGPPGPGREPTTTRP